ncbi:MAG: TolC family protein [Bdellovibrionales bacterium]|nr:TolC family protein [Bdellovibrionales bacterium]
MILIFSLDAMARTMTVDESVEQALRYSPALQLQNNKMEQVKHEYRSALGGALPHISLSYDFNKFNEKPVISGFSLNSDFERTLGVTITQPIYAFGAVTHVIKAADAAIEMSKLGKAVTVRELKYGVKLSYYSVLLAQKQLEIANESLKNAKANLGILQSYFASGRPPQQDLIRLQADVAARSSQVQEAAKGFEQAKTQFKILLGLSLDEKVDLVDIEFKESAFLSEKDLMDEMMKGQPQLKIVDKQVEYADRMARAQESKVFPRLGAFYNYSSSERSNRGWSDTDSTINSSVIGLNLSWDIWSGGTNRADIEKAHNMKNAAEIEKIKQKDQLVQMLSDKVTEYNRLMQMRGNDRNTVKLAQQSFKVSQNRFKTGKTSVTELNGAELLLYQAMLTQAVHDFKIREAFAAVNKLVEKK